MTNIARLKEAISKFDSIHVLVIGDIILDRFMWGSVSRISPEAPVPIVEIEDESTMLGGAANVFSNLRALGAQSILFGVIGADREGSIILDMVRARNSSLEGIEIFQGHRTSTKVRVIAHSQQIVRFDREMRLNPPQEYFERAWARINSFHFDIVIISDYDKGLISEDFLQSLNFNGCPVLMDTKSGKIEYCKYADILTSNVDEIAKLGGPMMIPCPVILITKGKAGVELLEQGRPALRIPSKVKEVFDVSGAGDTVTAVMALGVAAGLSYSESAELANAAAGVVVGKVGTATLTKEELLECI